MNVRAKEIIQEIKVKMEALKYGQISFEELEQYIKDHKSDDFEYGQTLMMLVAKSGMTRIVQMLIDNGADIDSKDINGETALILAAKSEKPLTVKVLLDNGANPSVTNKDKKTAIDLMNYEINNGRDIHLYNGEGLKRNILNKLKTVSILEKSIKDDLLTDEESAFKASENYKTEDYKNLISRLYTEKKFQEALDDEDRVFMESDGYNPKYEIILAGVTSVVKHNPLLMDGKILTRLDAPMFREITKYLTRENHNKFKYISKDIAEGLREISVLPEITAASYFNIPEDYKAFSLPGYVEEINAVEKSVRSENVKYMAGLETGLLIINPAIRCLDNYLNNVAQEKPCSKEYTSAISINNLQDFALSVVSSFALKATYAYAWTSFPKLQPLFAFMALGSNQHTTYSSFVEGVVSASFIPAVELGLSIAGLGSEESSEL